MFFIKALSLLALPGLFASSLQAKPLESVTAGAYYAGEDLSFIENSEGLKFRRGLNGLFMLDGGLTPWTNGELRYTLRQDVNGRYARTGLHKGYIKQLAGKFSFTLGKDSEHIGHGYQALLLSKNAPPFFMLRAKTEQPLQWHGKWNLIALNGWLFEHRQDRNDPKVFIGRIDWAPTAALEFGATRGSQYGGERRPALMPWDIPYMLVGSDENSSTGRFNTDGYLSYDIALNVPQRFIGNRIKSAKIYYEKAGTDVLAMWQKEDGQYYFPFGIKLHIPAYLAGATVTTEKHELNLEFLKIPRLFYTHSWYPIEGYSYGGLSLGAPYGTNYQSFIFTHTISLNGNRNLKYQAKYIKQETFKYAGMERYGLAISGTLPSREIEFSPYVAFDYAVNRDPNPLPAITEKGRDNKFYVTLGLSGTFKF